jgi:prevent-host-death family protein
VKRAVNIYDAKANLSRLIATVEKTGRPLSISRNGVPVVDLVPHRKVKDPLAQDPSLAGAVFVGDPATPADERMWPAKAR